MTAPSFRNKINFIPHKKTSIIFLIEVFYFRFLTYSIVAILLLNYRQIYIILKLYREIYFCF